ncbi:MAG: AAA family ATPase, partial [Actinobacteria bacterium]|nr:AAA family ATPase [Actinomycetota bacterium]
MGGNGSMVLIAGEAGAGKTTLVGEFAARVGRRALVLSGACDPLTTPRPLGPLLDIASEEDSGLGPVDLDSDSGEIFTAFLGRLRATIRPIVVVLEDLH